MRATIDNVCIRGCEEKDGRNGKYLLVRYEDETGKAEELVDKDLTRATFYKRDTLGKLHIRIDRGKQFTNISITDFEIQQ